MQRDPQTGLPLIGVRDTRPIRLKITTNGANVSVTDAETGRPIDGIQSIEWSVTPKGARLALLMSPLIASIDLSEADGVLVQPPVQIQVPSTGQPLSVREGEQMLLVDGERAVALLTVNLIDQGPTPVTPDDDH
jgi:hypothetical protein